MRNRRREKTEEDNFEERRKRRAENSEILRRIAEKLKIIRVHLALQKKNQMRKKKLKKEI